MFPSTFAIVTFLSCLIPHVFTQTSDCSTINTRTTPALNITALDAIDGKSVIQCWQLDPFTTTSTPGTGTDGSLNLDLGNTTQAQYFIIPGRYNAGLHNPGAKQFVYYTSGLVRFSLPNSTEEAWIHGGKYGLIYAQDLKNVSAIGHYTEYVSDEATVRIVIPLAPGTDLKHTVLHSGGCTWAEMAGL